MGGGWDGSHAEQLGVREAQGIGSGDSETDPAAVRRESRDSDDRPISPAGRLVSCAAYLPGLYGHVYEPHTGTK